MYDYPWGNSQSENSPEELVRYRGEYLRIVLEMKSKDGVTKGTEVDVTLTQQSLVVQTIYMAANNETCTHETVLTLLKEIARLMAPASFQELEKDELLTGKPHATDEESGVSPQHQERLNAMGEKNTESQCDADC